MQRLTNWLAWGVVALIAALAILNLQALMTPTSVNLLAVRIDAPLGALMLALTALLVLLFAVATMRNQIGTLLENRRLLKELHRVQGLADRAETSRVDNLHQLTASEFRLLNERLDAFKRA